MFRGSVKGTGYPLHSPVSPSLPPPVRHSVPSHFIWNLYNVSRDCCATLDCSALKSKLRTVGSYLPNDTAQPPRTFEPLAISLSESQISHCPDRFWGPPSLQFNGTECSLAGGIKRTRREVDHSPPSRVQITKEWSHNSSTAHDLTLRERQLYMYK